MTSRSPSWYADVPTRVPAAAPARGGRWLKTCGAICAAWGYGCQRLAPHPGLKHRHGRGEFERVAAPGQTSFPKTEELVAAAQARRGGGTAELAEGPARLDRLEVRRRKQAARVAGAAGDARPEVSK